MTNNVCFALNENAYRIAELMIKDSEKYNISVECVSNGVRILDAGLSCKGSILAYKNSGNLHGWIREYYLKYGFH